MKPNANHADAPRPSQQVISLTLRQICYLALHRAHLPTTQDNIDDMLYELELQREKHDQVPPTLKLGSVTLPAAHTE